MRIVLDGIPLLTQKAGIGRYTFEISEALKRLPEAPDVFFFYGVHRKNRLRGGQHDYNQKNKKNIIDGIIRRTPDRYKIWLKKKIEKLEFQFRKPDIFHATNYSAEYFDIPMVTTVHDLAFIRYPETLPADRLAWLDSKLPDTLKNARKIITVSQFTKDELITLLGVPENRIKVIYEGVTNNFKPRSSEIVAKKLKKYNLPPNGYILSVGTIEPRKNIQSLLHAYMNLPDSLKTQWPLVIVGMDGWKNREIFKKMENLAAKGELQILDYVSDEILPYIYAGASLFVYPSLYEGFGLPPLEAMACGVPVIVSNKASLPEVVGKAGIIVDPEDIGLLTKTINSILEDSKKRHEMSIEGLQRAKQFSWEVCAKRTFKVYQDVL